VFKNQIHSTLARAVAVSCGIEQLLHLQPGSDAAAPHWRRRGYAKRQHVFVLWCLRVAHCAVDGVARLSTPVQRCLACAVPLKGNLDTVRVHVVLWRLSRARVGRNRQHTHALAAFHRHGHRAVTGHHACGDLSHIMWSCVSVIARRPCNKLSKH
jgi:hypothetical protein